MTHLNHRTLPSVLFWQPTADAIASASLIGA